MVLSRRISGFVCLIFLTFPAAAWAASSAGEVTEGNRLYKEGSFEDAAARYNAALARGGQEAVARYNLGNAMYKQGKALEEKDIDRAIGDMQQSLGDYEQVLKKNAKDADAQYNYDFVKKELERLKKKQQEQQQQKQQQQQQQNKQDQQKKQQQPQQGQDQRQAKDILEDYQRTEEPQGLLNFIPKDKPEKPVEKDW